MSDTRILASRVMECFICKADAAPEQSTLVEVSMLAPDFKLAVAVCPACTARAIAEDGSTDALIADIRETYPRFATLTKPAPKPTSTQIELQPRTARNAGRRHPAYGAAITADPPPADEPLRVLMGWEHADTVPDPKLIVRPADNPAHLRFDVAAKRIVRVFHPDSEDPNRLYALAQSLIDYGAAVVELVIHPPRPEAHSTELLRIVPKGGA